MTDWVCNFWKPNVHGEMLFTLDQHRAQKTPSVLSKLKDECITAAVLIPPGCKSLIKPLDVVFNGPFKKAVDNFATAHVETHTSCYVHGSFTASDHRILLTEWIGKAWEEISAKNDMVM